MRPQIHRLPADTAKGFGGTAIDRSRPLQFRLDGRLISGFAGDTVLSALLASGVDTLGEHEDHPVALGFRATPAIAHAALAGDRQRALPMARTPAFDGMDLVTLGSRRRNAWARLFQPGRTLGFDLDSPHILERPWRDRLGMAEPATELLVVGSGVAGLSAALAGARAGLAVTLIEANPHLGGHSGLFGTQEGEDSPEDSMARLVAEVRASDAIRVLAATRAYALRPGLVRVHSVDLAGALPQGRVIDLPAPRIVVATGALERLPVFAGNRLPGVTGSLDAYELAYRYGVWPGRNALFATTGSHAYRLALLAQDADLAVDRILDSRPHPASRFIEFAKAYGIRQFPGTTVRAVTPARTGQGLAVEAGEGNSVTVERLVAAGGWQPDLTLWHVAGGNSQWAAERHRLEAASALDGIVLAGSAAGCLTRHGCIQSGADAVDQLLGRDRRQVQDTIIDPLYETPDDPAFVAPPAPEDGPPAYLDGAIGLLQRPEVPRKSWLGLFQRRPRHGLGALSEAPQPLAICDVAAGVELNLIPPASAGIVAQERVALVPLAPTLPQADNGHAHEAAKGVPAYLADRFGADARLVAVIPDEPRRLETGALIHASADRRDPLGALGVVIRQEGDIAMALVARNAPETVVLRDHGREITAHIEDWLD